MTTNHDHDGGAADHRQLRMLLGSYALGHLGEDEAGRVRAHLDGCAECRAELAEIEPVASALSGIDPRELLDRPTPSPDLGERLRDAVREERTGAIDLTSRRRARHARGTAALAASVVAAALVGTFLLGRGTAPEPPTVAMEPVTLTSSAADPVTVEKASLIAHSWGVELRFTGAGFADGEVFRAAFRDTSGELVPAGEFLGTGKSTLNCNLQSATLRDDVVQIVITDEAGTAVLDASI